MSAKSKNNILDDPIQVEAINKIVHEPGRLLILAHLDVVESLDFVFLMNSMGMSQGNLSSHISKLETVEYVRVEKEFFNKRPRTIISITSEGEHAFHEYLEIMQKLVNLIQD